MPGMIIPDLEIRYAGMLKMTCDAQVIYRRKVGKGTGSLRSGHPGYGFPDLPPPQPYHGPCREIPMPRFASEVEMDALWEFFFDTGFIYPKKYHLLQSCREEFKETYRKLYQEDQEIEAHFTYEKNGRIYGHVSMFRAYQRAWMVHHLAARPMNGKRTGLTVLKNVLRFFDGLYRYPSIRMDHMIFYFRPENHFPNLFFGGFARDFGNPRGCSLDLFAYMSHPTDRPAGSTSRKAGSLRILRPATFRNWNVSTGTPPAACCWMSFASGKRTMGTKPWKRSIAAMVFSGNGAPMRCSKNSH